MAGLQVIQSLVQEKGRLLAPSSTRWLSVERSVNRLKACFSSVVISLQRGEERSDAKALGLNSLVSEYRFVCTMLLMCDALPHVSHLSKCFLIVITVSFPGCFHLLFIPYSNLKHLMVSTSKAYRHFWTSFSMQELRSRSLVTLQRITFVVAFESLF